MQASSRKILLATDGSKTAAAVELSEKTGSQLHVVYVGPDVPAAFAQTDLDPPRLEQEARKTLDELVEKIREADGPVAEAHLRLGDAAERISL